MAWIFKKPGFLKRCSGCGAVISYRKNEIKEGGGLKEADFSDLLCDRVPSTYYYIICPSCSEEVKV